MPTVRDGVFMVWVMVAISRKETPLPYSPKVPSGTVLQVDEIFFISKDECDKAIQAKKYPNTYEGDAWDVKAVQIEYRRCRRS